MVHQRMIHPRPRSRSPRQPYRSPTEEIDDAASFMAHQPHQVEDQEPVFDMPQAVRQDEMESSSNSADSTYDSDVQSIFFHLFQLRAPMVAARIRSDTWASTYSNVRHVLQLERHEIQYLHLVQTSPPDLQIAGTWAAIVQKRQDFAPGDVRRCILVDVIFHENQPQNLNVHRYAHAVRKDMTRRVLLEELGIQPYCAAVRQRCIVRVNNRVIQLGSPVLFPISRGDYVRVDLPPHPRMQIPTRAIARCLRDGHRIQQVPRIYSDADTDFEWETVTNPDVTHDEVSMIQLPGQRTASRCLTAETVAHAQRPGLQPQQLSLEELIPKPSHTQVDFSAVQWFWYELQQIQLDVWEEWPADFALPEVANDIK